LTLNPHRWTDPSSLSGLLQRSPEGIHHLLVSYSEASAQQDAQWMHDQARGACLHLLLHLLCLSAYALVHAQQCDCATSSPTPHSPTLPYSSTLQLRTHAKRIWMPWREREALFERLHFAIVPVSRVPGALPGVLREWTYGQRCVRAAGGHASK
jgi:hypothetical protein